MCFLMEGNNFSHTNTFLFESILFFFAHPPKSDAFLEGKQHLGKPLRFERNRVLARSVSLPASQAQKLHLKLTGKLLFSRCLHT